MVTWRPIKGEIVRLDPTLATVESIEDFFARHKIIARGEDQDEAFRLELAATGRRRRVAQLDAAGDVVPGPSLSELVELLDKELRKVQIDIDGQVAWGNIDLGEVDVEWDDLDGTPDRVEPEVDEEGIEGPVPEFLEGPMLAISDVSFARLPTLAASIESPVAAFDLDKANAILADVELAQRNLMVMPEYVIVLSTDPTGLDRPVLSIRQDSMRRSWNWQGELPNLPWVASSDVAAELSEAQLGAGAFVTRICADLPSTEPEKLRACLLGSPEDAGRAFIDAVGLAPEVADCLEGLLEARLVPGATVFEPKPFPERLQSSVAYEVAGQGRAKPGFWKIYRKLYLENPRAMEALASLQAGLGALAFAAGVKRWGKTSGKLLAVLGSGLAINAGTRILVTQWIQAALDNEGLSGRGSDARSDAEGSLNEPLTTGGQPSAGSHSSVLGAKDAE